MTATMNLDQAARDAQPAAQVGAICVDPATGRVLMITSRGTGRWVIPKGWPMAGRTDADAALQEAWEEAGVRGSVLPDEIGRYVYDKIRAGGMALPVEVRVFRVEVDSLADIYPEGTQRRRRWLSPDKAARLVAETGLSQLLVPLAPAGPARPRKR